MEVDCIAERQFWRSRYAFVMAAIGSAVGLGNVWRFPFVCYKNGGGAFLIPYFIALFTTGIPLMILEFSLGHWARGSPPYCFLKANKKFEWIGWFASLAPFVIASYYTVVMAWCFAYMIYSIDLRWGSDANLFFLKHFLNATRSPAEIGSIQIPVLLGLVVVWFSIFVILYKGVSRIGKVVAVTVPLPTILLIILTIRGLTLPGAMEGIDYYLTPDFSKLSHFKVWLSAYAQVFFSLSLAQGILITYASFLRKESDITNNAFIISLADAGTSFLAGFAVFSIVGYLSLMKGIGIENLGLAGPHLTFVTYPTAISLLPFGTWLFGMIFYIALLAFGIDSAFSMIEPLATSINSKWKFSKGKATAIACALGFLSSLIFVTSSGIYWLDIVDHFVANFCLVLIGLLECISLGYLFDLKKLREHANEVSDITIGRWWDFLIKFVAPLSLLTLLVASVVENISVPYNNYPTWCLLVGGVMPGAMIFILSFIFANR